MAKNIEKVSAASRASIRSLSAYSLPTSPSARGKTPDDIKKAIYEPVIGETNNVLNELDRVVDEANVALSEINAGIGEVSALTTDESTLVGAINEHDGEIGNTSSLTTSESTLVGAINEHDAEIGALDELRSDTRTSLVDAINRVTDLIAVYPFNEDMSGHEYLQTTSKTLVGAINEHDREIGNVDGNLTGEPSLAGAINAIVNDIGGTLWLTTTSKTLVGAVNETNVRVDRNTADIEQNCTDIGNLKSKTDLLEQSVGAHDSAIGSGNLATVNKTIISAINENRWSIINVKADVDYVKSEVSGTAKNYVLDTFADFIRLLNGESVLPNEYDFGYLSTGDNILIVEHNVPDFWAEDVYDDEERFKNAGTYTYDGVEYSLGVRYEDGVPAVIFHILESDYTVIAGHATIASESASDALKYANNASDSADRAEAAEVNARKSEDRTQGDANAAKESKEIAVLAAEEAKASAEFVSANVLKGQAQGNPIVLDDVLPVEHEIACKVEGKNLLPPLFTEDIEYVNGSTARVGADGSITIHKVGGRNVNITVDVTLPVGTYTLSNGLNVGDKSCYIQITVGGTIYSTMSAGSRTFTIQENASYKVTLYADPNVEFDSMTLYPQIEVGEVATPYTPYIESVDGLEVKAYGKNLLSNAVYDLNNWVRDEGVSINSSNSKVYYLDEIPNGVYTVSAKANDTGVYLYFFYSKDGGATWEAYNGKNGVNYILASANAYTITFEKTDNTRFLLWKHDVNWFNRIDYIQIEAGATATEYEPYKEPITYYVDADGNVVIPSFAPNMTITSNGGVVLDASYNRDINALNTALDLTAVEAKINAAKQENAAKIASTNQAIGAQDSRITAIEKWIGKQGDLIVESDTSGNINIPSGAHKYALILENHGHESAYRDEYYYWAVVGNYPQKIVTDTGDTLFEMPSDLWKLSDFGIQGNYICFEDDKVYYKQTTKREDYYYEPTEGERMIEQYSDTTSIVALAEPIVTDVTEMFSASPIIDLSRCKYITVVPMHTEEEVKQMSIDSGSYDYEYSMPTVKIAFEV